MLKQKNTLDLIKKEESDISINIVLLGDSKCGKSSLINCFLNLKFEEQDIETIIELSKFTLKVGNHCFTVNLLYQFFKIFNLILYLVM